MESSSLFIPTILGTERMGSQSTKVAHFVHDALSAYPDVDTELVLPVNYVKSAATVPPGKDEVNNWQKVVVRADGFLIITPEYNHSFPGELKLLLDMAYKEYNKKAVALCGVSSGGLGGARVVEHLKPVLVNFGLTVLKGAVYFSKIKEFLAEDGKIVDTSYNDKIKKLLDELVWYARIFKEARA